ncbi:hypothetical protein GF374_01935 [Candidatus Woesearchaeota archaeon]|nr:hypothetical protein [Candidatus Woesearchaeota archaeon]
MARKGDFDPQRFGLACGIVSGVWLLILAMMGKGTLVTLLADLFPGYAVGGMGGVIGLVYGIIVFGITGYIFAWVYNYLKGKIK